MSFDARMALRMAAATALLWPVACSVHTVRVVDDDFSRTRTSQQIAADQDYCDDLAWELLDEFGPPIGAPDPETDSATARIGHRSRLYEAACLRVKGYQVESALTGTEIDEIDLPPAAVERIQGVPRP